MTEIPDFSCIPWNSKERGAESEPEKEKKQNRAMAFRTAAVQLVDGKYPTDSGKGSVIDGVNL